MGVELLLPLLLFGADCRDSGARRPMPAADYDAIVVPYIQAKKKIETGFVEEGIGMLRRLTQAQPDLAFPHRVLAQVYVDRSSWVHAYTSYTRVAQSDTIASKDRRAAAQELPRLAPKHPALAHYEKALQLYSDRLYREAVEWALLSQQAKPEFGLAYRLACLAYARLGDAARALPACREYVLLDSAAPDRATFADVSFRGAKPLRAGLEPTLDKAMFALLKDDPAAALALLRPFQHPTSAPVCRLIARAALASGDRREARDNYETFLALNVGDEDDKRLVRRTLEGLP